MSKQSMDHTPVDHGPICSVRSTCLENVGPLSCKVDLRCNCCSGDGNEGNTDRKVPPSAFGAREGESRKVNPRNANLRRVQKLNFSSSAMVFSSSKIHPQACYSARPTLPLALHGRSVADRMARDVGRSCVFGRRQPIGDLIGQPGDR